MKTLFVGIDISKRKFDAAITNDCTDFQVKEFPNNLSGFNKFSLWLKHFEYSLIHFCLESTSSYHNELEDFIRSIENSIISIINPYQIKHFGQSIQVRCKTDKLDACLIARFAFMNRPKETLVLSLEQRQLRELTRFLESLIKDKTRQLIKLETIKNSNLKQYILKNIDFINLQIDEVEKLIKNFINDHSSIKSKVCLLKTIEGIGDKTAWILISEMINDKNLSPKSQVAHAGLDPVEIQSGSSVKRKSRISNKGNSRLRKCLYMPALTVTRKSGYLRDFYNRLISKGKSKKVALTAVMKKLLLTASAILNNDTPFDPNWIKIQQKNLVLVS